MTTQEQVQHDADQKLLDHFAGLAMQAIISKSPFSTAKGSDPASVDIFLEKCIAVVTGAYTYAQAMLEARKSIGGAQ